MPAKIDSLKVRARWLVHDVRLVVQRAIQGFVDDRCTQLAASISYFVFFSVFPLLILLVTIFGQFLRNQSVRERVIDVVLDVVPLAPVEGREQLEEILGGVTTDLSLLGLFSIIGLLWSASAMMGALRNALNTVWDSDYRRPPVQGKLIDVLMTLGAGLLVGLSIVATGLRPYVRDLVDDVASRVGVFGDLLVVGLWLMTYLVPIVVSFGIFTALYRFAPAVRTSFAQIWPGALFAAVAFEIAKVGFTFYISHFGNYNAIYGSLGAVVVFMLFIYIAANVMLMGGEVAAEWPRVRAGQYDIGAQQTMEAEATPLRVQVVQLLRQLVFGPEDPPVHVNSDEIEERSRQRAEARARQLTVLRDAERADRPTGTGSTPNTS